MALIGIGDIHGCVRTLDDLIRVLDPSADDHLVFIGDYIDRGPDSRGVIDFVLELSRSVRCTFLRGNHEVFFLEHVHDGFSPYWPANGGDATLSSYRRTGAEAGIPRSHVDFVEATKLVFETPDFVFVHAGMLPEYSVARNLEMGRADVFLWERSHIDAERVNWEKTVVCGHTPVAEPINRPRLINIDTGCVYHTQPGLGTLTAVVLPEREFIRVPYSG
jgi:serine/threonine protein phosphatase 1